MNEHDRICMEKAYDLAEEQLAKVKWSLKAEKKSFFRDKDA